MRRFGEFTGAVTCRKAADHIVPSTSSDVLKKLLSLSLTPPLGSLIEPLDKFAFYFLGAAQLYHEISNSEQARF